MIRFVLIAAAVGIVSACSGASTATAGPPPGAGADLQITSRNVALTGEIKLAKVEKTAAKLMELDGISHDPIFLKINAFGDNIEAAFALVDTIRAIRSPVHAVIESRAYDMGAVVALACARTYIYPNAVVMLRAVEKVSTEAKVAKEPDEVFLKKFAERTHRFIAESIGMPLARYEEKVQAGWWLTAHEAVKAGIADEVVGSLGFRELFIEKTEIKTTVTTIEEKQHPGDAPGARGKKTPETGTKRIR